MSSNVYVIASSKRPMKIGTANNPKRRRHSLQSGNSAALKVIHVRELSSREMALHVESYAHWLLREKKVLGDWFDVDSSAAIIAIDEAVIAVASGKRAKLSVGRKKEFTERILQPFRDGTLARIAAVLEGEEDRTAFIREAVERELKRREVAKKRSMT